MLISPGAITCPMIMLRSTAKSSTASTWPRK
jgi:hypothetical protein